MELDNKNQYSNQTKPAYYFYRRPVLKFLFKTIDSFGFLNFRLSSKIKKTSGKILIINLGGAGDLIISEPLLSALASFSENKVDLICFPGQEKALIGLACLGKIYNLELPWIGGRKKIVQSLIDLFNLKRILKKEKYPVVVDIKGDPLIILLMFFSKIPARVGFSNGGLGFLLTHPISTPENLKRFKVDLVLGESFEGDKFKNFARDPLLLLPGDSNKLKELRESSLKKIITVHLGASCQARCWPLENWAALLSELVAKYNIVIVGSPKDLLLSKSLDQKIYSLCTDLSGQPWLETAKAIAESDLFIGANSGPAHLAAALNCPVINIFSAANDAEVWAPPKAEVLIFKPECAGCELNYCDHLSCLKAITPQMVKGAVLEILET